MGQIEVLGYLENQRAMGNEKFFEVKEIQRGLRAMGYGNGVIKGVSGALFKLACFNVIDWRGKGIWNHRKFFRAKLMEKKD